MNIYSVDVQVCATAYVLANSEEEALGLIQRLRNQTLELEEDGDLISGAPFDDPNFPDLSLSPAMTIHGVWPGSPVVFQEERDAD